MRIFLSAGKSHNWHLVGQTNDLFAEPTTEKCYISPRKTSATIKQQTPHLRNFQKFGDGRDFFTTSLNQKQQK